MLVEASFVKFVFLQALLTEKVSNQLRSCKLERQFKSTKVTETRHKYTQITGTADCTSIQEHTHVHELK